MRPYGQKHASKICECVQCGKTAKASSKKRARAQAKEEIGNRQGEAEGLRRNDGGGKKGIR